MTNRILFILSITIGAVVLMTVPSHTGEAPIDTVGQVNDSAEVQWVEYTNHIFGYEVEYPGFLDVEENYKHAFWKREHGRHDLLKRGIEITFSLPEANVGITITTRECDVMEDCQPGETDKGAIRKVEINGVSLCRYGYIDYAMGGKWGLNIWYRVRYNGVCYRIGYFGFRGAIISADGAIELPKSRDEAAPEMDPGIFERIVSSFWLTERWKP